MIKREQQQAINQFIKHWKKYHTLQPYHTQWLQQQAVYRKYPRKSCVYDSLWEEECIFYVCTGLLAMVNYSFDPKTQQEKRNILHVALPQMILMSTFHLHSKTQVEGEIIALRPSQVLSISYEKIHRFMRDDPSLNSLLQATSNKMNRQLTHLRRIDSLRYSSDTYTEFMKSLPELAKILSQTEQQDLLGISRSSIQRASLLNLRPKKG